MNRVTKMILVFCFLNKDLEHQFLLLILIIKSWHACLKTYCWGKLTHRKKVKKIRGLCQTTRKKYYPCPSFNITVMQKPQNSSYEFQARTFISPEVE